MPDPTPPPTRPVHPIRLRGPWEWTPADAGSRGPTRPARVTLPHTAAAPGTLTRRFNTPTGLGDGERVLLHVATRPLDAAVTVNGTPAGPPPADLTDALRPAGAGGNVLAIAVTAGTVDGVTLGIAEPPG